MKPLPAISLRALEPEDLDLLYRIENDDALWGVGITNVPYSRFLLHEFLSSSTGDIYTDKQVRLVIENESHQTVVISSQRVLPTGFSMASIITMPSSCSTCYSLRLNSEHVIAVAMATFRLSGPS